MAETDDVSVMMKYVWRRGVRTAKEVVTPTTHWNWTVPKPLPRRTMTKQRQPDQKPSPSISNPNAAVSAVLRQHGIAMQPTRNQGFRVDRNEPRTVRHKTKPLAEPAHHQQHDRVTDIRPSLLCCNPTKHVQAT